MDKIEPKWEYWATIVRWVDGDTVKMTVDQGFNNSLTASFRVLGLDTPERGKPKHDEAWHRAEELAPVGTVLPIRSHKGDKYGRWLADIQLGDGRLISVVLIEEGWGVYYNGGTKSEPITQ